MAGVIGETESLGGLLDRAVGRELTQVHAWRRGEGSVKTWDTSLFYASSLDFNGLGALMATALVSDVGSFSDPRFTGFRQAVAESAGGVTMRRISAVRPRSERGPGGPGSTRTRRSLRGSSRDVILSAGHVLATR